MTQFIQVRWFSHCSLCFFTVLRLFLIKLDSDNLYCLKISAGRNFWKKDRKTPRNLWKDEIVIGPWVYWMSVFIRRVHSETATGVVSVKKGAVKNFAKFTGKHLCQTLAQVFSSEFCEISNNIYFTEHLRTTASIISWSFHHVNVRKLL